MKRILLLIIALIPAGFFPATAQEIFNDSVNGTPRIENGNLIVTVDDIKSVKVYNFILGEVNDKDIWYKLCEIEFVNLKPNDLSLKINTLGGLVFLLFDDTLLFDPAIEVFYGAYSRIPPDLYLDVGRLSNNDIFMLRTYFHYNDYPWITDEEIEQSRKEMVEKRNLRIEQYEVFLRYMKDAGKLIDVSTGMEPIATQGLIDVSIYPNPTTEELKIESEKLKIENAELFDIHGRKILNSQFSTLNSIDISRLPAGLYFVKITTEKGAVTKKIVKK